MLGYRIFNLPRYIILVLLCCYVWGCSRKTNEHTDWQAPSWTSDGKVIFMEHYYIERSLDGALMSYEEGGKEEVWLCEINSDGTNLRKVKKVLENKFWGGCEIGLGSTSSAGEWIAFNIGDNRGDNRLSVIYVIKKDGTELKKVGEGLYPDFSPDASKIVYQKLNQGIWIINRDGTNDHQLIINGNNVAWSPDGEKIAYNVGDKIFISDTLGNNVDSLRKFIYLSDWGPLDSNAILVTDWKLNKSIILYLTTHLEDTLAVSVGKWSPAGDCFMGYDENGYFIIKRDGTNKLYLKP
ncbi:MAG: hypothetical protein WC614_13550 [bacterium]